MTKLRNIRAKTEIEEIKDLIPNYDNIPLTAEYDSNGNLIKIETNNQNLIEALKNKGLIEE